MPQPKKGPRLGTGPKHQRRMLSNLAVSLFEHERIRTTEAKAKALRPYAERLITKAKKGSVHDRRRVLASIEDRDVVHKLFADIGPRFADRNGGYTRILKLGPRHGDAAPMALIELVEGAPATTAAPEDEGRRRGVRRRRRRGGPSAEAPAVQEAEAPPEEEGEPPTEEEPEPPAEAEEADEEASVPEDTTEEPEEDTRG